MARTPPADDQPVVILDRRTLQRARRKERKKQRRRWPRRLLIVLSCLIVLMATVVVGGFVYANYQFNKIHKIHSKHLRVAAAGKPFNILIVGSDSRAFVTNSVQANAFGSASQEGGQRSDVTMIARIIPGQKQVYVLSIPRDLWVDIPGHVPGISGMNRINAAFNNGPDLLIQTIEQDLHIPINHYVSVNFNGFQGMVDALGGITMNFPTELKDPYSGLDVTQTGCQLVPGTTALELVRARHLSYMKDGYWQYDGLSDFSRIQRQDAFFRALLQKLNSVKFNLFTVNSFIGAAVKDLTIDDTLSEGDLISMAEEFHGLGNANLHTQTLPTTSYTTSGGASVLLEAQPYAQDMVAGF
ncbi:MAG: LCP family protein, partial [Acidimicrobiales bacterium]